MRWLKILHLKLNAVMVFIKQESLECTNAQGFYYLELPSEHAASV
jgi:hypothetical protein